SAGLRRAISGTLQGEHRGRQASNANSLERLMANGPRASRPLMIMSGRDARGPQDYDAPPEWRAPSNDTGLIGPYAKLLERAVDPQRADLFLHAVLAQALVQAGEIDP